ncbi:B12-binding domain-containing radical SAM protein [Acidobacteriota bacterium]
MPEFCNDLTGKISRLRFNKGEEIAFIAVPTPILMEGDKVLSPNRTNYFPISQLTLATSLKKRLEKENIPWNVTFSDFKSLENIDTWDKKLSDYGEVKYADKRLTKCVIGNGMGRIKNELPDKNIICITANFTFEANVIKNVIHLIKRENKNCIIILGGKDASARPEFYLSHGADIIASGDADLTLPELICRLYRGKMLDDILKDGILRNTNYIDINELPLLDLSLIKNTFHRYIESGGGGFLDSITKKGNTAYFESSRGCYRECDFCTERLSQFSEMYLDRYLEEVNWYKKNNVHTIMFIDDNMMLRMDGKPAGERNLFEMFDYLRKQNMVWEFPIGLEVGQFMDAQRNRIKDLLLEVMFWNNDSIKDFSGAFRMLFPIENLLTGEEQGENLSKMRSLEDNMKILAMIISKGIPQVNLGIMIGWAADNKQKIGNLEKSIDQIRRYCEHINSNSTRMIKTAVNYSIFCTTPLPGTPLYQQMLKEKRIKYAIETDSELWNLYTSVLEGDCFKSHEITSLRQDLLTLFHSQHESGKVKLHLFSNDINSENISTPFKN